MNHLLNNGLYSEQLKKAAASNIPWQKFDEKTFLISGATGMIGSCLTDILMHYNTCCGGKIRIIALGRNEKKAYQRFEKYWNNQYFSFKNHDVNDSLFLNEYCSYIIHGASNTHPVAYSTDPIGTVTANIIGLKNMLDYAVKNKYCRFAFLSSVEIYGENRGDTEKFSEDYCGYIDCNTLRAGYPESKRAGEALCQAYKAACGLDVVIPRFSRVYGPTMLPEDSKAIAQFIKKAVQKEDIVLKSKGNQLYSYAYAIDAVSALLYVLAEGETGQAYNIASKNSDIALKDLAQILAGISGTKVAFELPDEIEAKGYSNATKALLNIQKLIKLGWESTYDIETGLYSTYSILKNL